MVILSIETISLRKDKLTIMCSNEIINDTSKGDVLFENDSLLVEAFETVNDSVRSSDINYVTQAKQLINNHKGVSAENSLTINHNLQKYLKELKQKLETVLSKSRAKYKSNEALIKRTWKRKESKSPIDWRTKSNYFAGKPYFKQLDLFAPPSNSDYLYRLKAKNEYFPIDHVDSFRLWTAMDKQCLVKGVTAQVVKFLSPRLTDATKFKARRRKSILKQDRPLESKTLGELLAQNSSFQIDWFTISTKDLSDRHSMNECIGIWNIHLNPSINRQPFTEEDNLKLIEIIAEFGLEDWDNIGLQLNGRSGFTCIVQYQHLMNDANIFKKCKWTQEEDQQLIEAVESCRMGTFIPWTTVSYKMPLRTKVQLYQRYMYTLKPDNKKGKFTIAEDQIIVAAAKEHGPNFKQLSILPERTLPQIRNHYQSLAKSVGNLKHWTYEDDVKLIELTNEMGTTDWANISKQLTHHTRQSCRLRYTTITKFLTRYPNYELKDVTRRERKFGTNVTKVHLMEVMKLENQSLEETKAGGNTAVGLKIHEYFKYSYNFQLKPLCDAGEPASDAIRTICYMLHSFVYPKDHQLLYGPIDSRYEMAAIANCEFVDDYLMPPNLNTALILRGLAIMYPDVSKDSEEFLVESPALQLFKKRLFTLLYSAAVASHIKFPVATSSGVAETQAKRQKM